MDGCVHGDVVWLDGGDMQGSHSHHSISSNARTIRFLDFVHETPSPEDDTRISMRREISLHDEGNLFPKRDGGKRDLLVQLPFVKGIFSLRRGGIRFVLLVLLFGENAVQKVGLQLPFHEPRHSEQNDRAAQQKLRRDESFARNPQSRRFGYINRFV